MIIIGTTTGLAEEGEEEFNMPQNISEFETLEYFLEFSPPYGFQKTTSYQIAIEHEGPSTLMFEVSYADSDLTIHEQDIEYNISLNDDFEWIINWSSSEQKEYMEREHSEIFANVTSPIPESQTFRVDEFLTYIDYIKTDRKTPIIETISREFLLVGQEKYSRQLSHEFNTYHFNSTWTFNGPASSGCP